MKPKQKRLWALRNLEAQTQEVQPTVVAVEEIAVPEPATIEEPAVVEEIAIPEPVVVEEAPKPKATKKPKQ